MEPQIQSYIVGKDYVSAVKLFGTLELQIEENSLWGSNAETVTRSVHFYASFMMCYLIIGDLSSAKYLWKRAPPSIKLTDSGSMLPEVWAIGKSVWQNDFPTAISCLSIRWPDELQLLSQELREGLFVTELATIASAYQHIPVEILAGKLGISQEETLQRVQSAGWLVEDGLVRPCSQSALSDKLGSSLSDNLALLHKVTGYAAHFDRAPVGINK